MTTDQHPPAPSGFERLLGRTEPVRRALYPVVLAVVALLVAHGVLDADRAPLWIALAVAVLGVGGVEAARSVTYAPATVATYGASWQAVAADEYARGAADALEDTSGDTPGAHAEDRTTESIPVPASTRATRCREVEGGRRCVLTREHDGPHHMTTG